MPISTVPGQGYGKATEQAQAQSAVPMGASPVAAPEAQPAMRANPMPRPGELPYIAPTQRPEEPVTSGINFGPGPGADAMGGIQPMMPNIIQQAQTTNSPMLNDVAAFMVRMGLA